MPRLDALGTLHRVMMRGIERTALFRDDTDRADFVTRPAVSRAREGIAYLWTTILGPPGRPLAPVLGIRPQNIYRAAAQGQTAGAEWERVLTTCGTWQRPHSS